MRDQVIKCFENARAVGNALLDGVDCERLAENPHDGAKHAAWVMTHLTLSAGMLAALLDESGQSEPFAGVPEAWSAAASPSAPISPDRSVYPTKADILEHYNRAHDLAAQRFSEVSDDYLTSPHPNPDYRSFWPTVADAAVYLATVHEHYHLGQMQQWRRAIGLGPQDPQA